MSAFLVSDDTIKLLALVGTAHYNGSWNLGDANDAAEAMYKANCESLEARYGDKAPEMFGYDPNTAPKVTAADASRLEQKARDSVLVLKQAHCLAYQACEYSGWERSAGKDFLDAAEAAAIRSLHKYAEAPWGL